MNLLEEVNSFDEDLFVIELENASKDLIAWSQITIIENTIDKIVEDSMIEAKFPSWQKSYKLSQQSKFMIWLMYSSISYVFFTEDSKKTTKSLTL
jgi:hypothetical protein